MLLLLLSVSHYIAPREKSSACDVEPAEHDAHDEDMPPVSESNMKITFALTGTELAFIDNLLRPDPVAVVIKVGHVLSLSHNFD